MSSASPSEKCVVCGRSLPAAGQACASCHASADWQDLIGAVEFAQSRLEQWAQAGVIGQEPLAAITAAYNESRRQFNLAAQGGGALPSDAGLMPSNRCWSCGATLSGSPSHCGDCGVPVEGELPRRLRYWTYTCGLIKSENAAGRLPLSQAHACINDAKGRIGVLRASLEKKREPILATEVGQPTGPERLAATLAGEAGAEPARVHRPTAAAMGVSPSPRLRKPRRPLWELLLDPRSIQWLLGLGGALFVLGLVIWLATLGIFKNHVIVAVILGLGNALVLGLGWLVTARTRYQTAGRALTLLACLVMPLNLWFYHAQELITIEGNLWVAALVCCVLYAASALVLRDRTFVYVLAGGVAMTGLLILADLHKFFEITSPSLLLVVLGLICLHAERAFPNIDSPFSRQRFGMAFFWSGQALLAAGLLLLLGAQIAGDWLYKPLFEQFYRQWHAGPPEVVTVPWQKLVALAIVIAATYAYAYSDLVVRRVGVYIYLAVFTLLWSEVLIINQFQLDLTTEVAIIALALTALASNVIAPMAARWQAALAPGQAAESALVSVRPLSRAAPPMGLILSTMPVLLGLLLFLRATYQPLNDLWPLGAGGGQYTLTWLYVGAMLLTVVACRIGAHLYRHTAAWLSATYFFGTAAATLLTVAGVLWMWDIKTWNNLAPVLMGVPILYVISARFYRGHSQERPLVWAAHGATAVVLVSALAAWAQWTPQHVFEPVVGGGLNLSLALVFAEGAVFYALATIFRKRGFNIYFCAASACGAAWQLLLFYSVGPQYYTLVFALAGFVLLQGYRLALWERTGMGEPAFQSANAIMSLSFVAAALLSLSRLAGETAHPESLHRSLIFLLLGLALLSLLAAWVVRHPAWRRWYLVMAIVEAALMFLVIHVLSTLSVWDKLEIFSVVVGLALLVVGHVCWHREDESQEDLVSFSLGVGSLLVAVPLTIAVLIHRCRPDPEFSTFNELGMLLAGVVLLASGMVLRLRSTTITGAAMLLVYLATLLLYINRLPNVQLAAIWMTIGGGVIVAAGVLLSVYRDRLLTLPDQVKRREGIFRVLTWR